LKQKRGTAAQSGAEPPRFASAGELREVLDRLLSMVDADEQAGPKLRAAKVPHRFVFTDFGVTLDVAGANHGEHSIAWSFDGAEWKPMLTLEMDSQVANRYLQGKLSLPVGLARGEVRIRCAKTRAALNLLPASRELIACYRGLIERLYPRLVIS
jgi:hypothetical protein